MLIDRLIASLDDGVPDEEVEQAWADGIKLRVGAGRLVSEMPGQKGGQKNFRALAQTG